MSPEDRVVTTNWLSDINSGSPRWAQLAPAILGQLDPMGLHVLVPDGGVHHRDEPLVLCRLQLHALDETIETSVVMPIAWFEELPTAFDVLGRVAALVPTLVESVDDSLSSLALDGQGATDDG